MGKVFKKVKTSDVSYLLSAPAGVPGDITRVDESSVEPIMLVAVSTVYATVGSPLKYVSGGAQQFNGGAEAATAFAGILIREAPSISGVLADDGRLSPMTPDPLLPVGMLVRGYISVICAAGTPARGGAVYIQIIANGGIAVGAFRATADGGNTVLLTATQAEWASDGLDSAGNAEIRVAR